MKSIITSTILALSISASAGLGLMGPSQEDIVSTALQSSELKQAKIDANFSSMELKDISVDRKGSMTEVLLTYSDGGAPCSAVVKVETKDRTPTGAAGMNIISKVVSAEGFCALH